MTEKQYRLNKWGTKLLKNNRPLFDWTNESDEIVDLLNQLNDENEQLQKELDYIQNSITEHIKHQKTELGQKALKEIITVENVMDVLIPLFMIEVFLCGNLVLLGVVLQAFGVI